MSSIAIPFQIFFQYSTLCGRKHHRGLPIWPYMFPLQYLTRLSASLTDCNLTKDELHALRRLRNDKDIVILPADKGRGTVVMDKKDYMDKMDSLVNDKEIYEPLKRDPTPALQRRLNGKLLDLKKTETIDIQLYYRLRCRVPQSAKPYGLPKLHKPNIPMRGRFLLQVSDHRSQVTGHRSLFY